MIMETKMRITLIWLTALVCFTSVSAGADFAVTPPKQVVTENQYTNALKRDPWEKDRWNYIDPKTGRRLGGFIKRDQWEPGNRWNIYGNDGHPAGVLKRDNFNSERWNYSGSSSTYGIGEYDDGIGVYKDEMGND
jgi:hypothetical protein